MAYRLFFFVLAQATLGLIGAWWLGWPGALVGAVTAASLMLILDSLRGRRVIRWLRAAEGSSPPLQRGLWGEVGYRVQRRWREDQEKIRDSAQRLQEFLAAIQASPNGVLLLDPGGHIEWCSNIAAQHFGLDPRRDLLQNIGNLVRDPAFTAYYNGGHYDREVRLVGRGGTTAQPLKLSVQLHPYGNGHKLMLSRDVTALAQAEAMRRDFVANVSHEIRTPLTVLAGFIETMQSLPLSQAERSRYLGLMAEQSQRMQTLVQDLLMLSRLEGRPLPASGEEIDLGALLAQCATEARGLSKLLHGQDDTQQRLSFGTAPDFVLMGSSSELHSAASNLINNAVRYTPAGGSIEARWESLADGRARLLVVDSGPGIAPEHLPRLGERFYRVDRSRSRESGGTGLGLAIAKHVAQRHGGELQVSSRLGEGSQFSLVFPAHRVRVSKAHAVPEPIVAR